MAQFDVHRNTNSRTARAIPFLIDVQHPILREYSTRIVVPLEATHDRAAARLNPVFEIEGHRVVMVTTQLAAIQVERLGPYVTNLSEYRAEILDALDFLWCGY